MPLVRRDGPAGASPRPAADPEAHLARLSSPDPEIRWSAARALHYHPSAVPALAAALKSEPVSRVREAIMTALMRIGDEASVAALLPSLRSQDAAERAASIAALQAMPEAIAPFLTALFSDVDADVRVLAAELTRNMPAAEATQLLSGVLTRDDQPNVCAAAIDVLAEIGTRDALPALKSCAARFAATPFLPFAAATAIARISDSEG